MIDDITEMLIPLGICVALPVLIVWLVTRAKINSDNRRSEILMEAIRNNELRDTDKLTDLFARKESSQVGRMRKKFSWGIVLTLMGIGMVVITCIVHAANGDWGNEGFISSLLFTILLLGAGIGLLISFFYQKYLLDKQPEEQS